MAMVAYFESLSVQHPMTRSALLQKTASDLNLDRIPWTQR